MQLSNLFAGVPDDLPEELVESLLKSESLRVERIVSRGHASPKGFWYDQPQHEWVVVLQGAARLKFEEEQRLFELSAGDALLIPAQQRHRVDWTTPDEPTIWLAIHFDGPLSGALQR